MWARWVGKGLTQFDQQQQQQPCAHAVACQLARSIGCRLLALTPNMIAGVSTCFGRFGTVENIDDVVEFYSADWSPHSVLSPAGCVLGSRTAVTGPVLLAMYAAAASSALTSPSEQKHATRP